MDREKETSSFSRLMEFTKGFQGRYVLSVIIAIIGVACGLIPYFMVSKMLVALLDGNKEVSFYVTQCLIAGVGYLGKSLFHNVSTYISHKATFAVISVIRYQVVKKLSNVPLGYILDTPSGKFKDTTVEKIDSIEPTLAHVVPEMTSNFLVPIAIVIYLFVIDWRMALVSLITLPVGFICYMGMMNGYGEKYAGMIEKEKEMSAVTVEYINGIEVIKAFNQSATSYKRFTTVVRAYSNYSINWMRSVQIYFAMGMAIWPAVLVGVLPVGAYFYMTGSLTSASFIMIMILSLGIMGPLLAAMGYTDDLAKIGAIVKDICEVIDQPELIRPEKETTISDYDISLKDVHFSYGDSEVLHGINLEIPKNTVTAFVGPSGGGKSTIAKLIASLWDVSSGSISIGDKDIKDISLKQFSHVMTYVSQDNYLFDDTIMNNIRMGNPDASDEEVVQIAKDSGCHEFIMSLEQGYQTIVGGAGGHLSGGERQRITIARAMLRNTPIVILDEATAYTDPENEAVIQRAVAKLVDGKTLIVIAHRLSTITDSDKIVVVDNGNIHAQGTHDELLKSDELYKSMWLSHIQSKDKEVSNV
ncbi:ABC transporter ATP-binding protein [Breznakia pachnodae]|uniref:ATP-binding cassette subfamily B protein n=1 Tax=Breznakia pachnodae TaxID=265178 RepID=A0ABU0E5S5_9FIRM|nr:ABC transporter ATP-binding protein [Breznakia pachnodae]MDQ0362251.1 ATP-binding cassette subfamily B protein [Breznakia pachnodae]